MWHSSTKQNLVTYVLVSFPIEIIVSVADEFLRYAQSIILKAGKGSKFSTTAAEPSERTTS